MNIDPIIIDSAEAQEKITARLLWKRTTENGYIDAGNVKEFTDATTRSLVTAYKARNGARFVGNEQVDVNHEAYTFLLDEHSAEQEQLIRLSATNTFTEQAAAEGASATLENVKLGRWHAIGAYGIANVQVTGALSGVLVEGTDYTLDKSNGRLFIPATGSDVAEGEDLTVTFDEPAIKFQRFASQAKPLFYCDIIIEETNQFSDIPLRRLTMTGYLSVTEFPSSTGEVSSYRAKVTARGPVTVDKRPKASSITVLTEHGEGPAKSSSSSSNSSSSSAISTSASSSSS
jgi:hypothetical protein